MIKFLTAEWRDLIMVNYEVDPSLLLDRLPPGTELDLHEGKCFVSLVGFMFLDTRVLRCPIPFHVNFEEVNLRFYVKREIENEVRRGVVFVKEIVPRSAIAFVARTFYGEPYEAWRMNNSRTDRSVSYGWWRGAETYGISVSKDRSLGIPERGSHGEFIIEHYWGYTKRGSGRTDEYKVAHQKWNLFSVNDPRIEVDFKKVYGQEFSFLNDASPFSILHAEGSEIAVYVGERIKT
jgi:uncharacterized protein YqjF (DUF2071 family)